MASSNQPQYLVLGLDPGIASCGFALLDMSNHEIPEIGSHLFPAPQEAKTKVSTAKTRRSHRSARRNTKRNHDRRKHILKLLQDYELVPKGETADSLKFRKGDTPILRLRVQGLDDLLNPRQFAQVLFSLAKHRGYIPHGDSDDGGDDTGKVLSAIKRNNQTMQTGGYRTVGEMFYKQGRTSRNKGGSYTHCVTNQQICEEVHLLF